MSQFSWQCQNLCILSLAFITYWKVVCCFRSVSLWKSIERHKMRHCYLGSRCRWAWSWPRLRCVGISPCQEVWGSLWEVSGLCLRYRPHVKHCGPLCREAWPRPSWRATLWTSPWSLTPTLLDRSLLKPHYPQLLFKAGLVNKYIFRLLLEKNFWFAWRANT